jgi:hypothetical protein
LDGLDDRILLPLATSELPHLRTFVRAAELGSFTTAAAELGVSQAAVSQRIAMLERQLRVSLFERGWKGLPHGIGESPVWLRPVDPPLARRGPRGDALMPRIRFWAYRTRRIHVNQMGAA